MANKGITKRILAISPYIELLVRRLYWNKVKTVGGQRRKKKRVKNKIEKRVDFGEIISFLRQAGVQENSLAVVHSAYGPLKPIGKSPKEIVSSLLSLIGDGGTLAMPAMAKFKNDVPLSEYLDADITDIIFTYDVKKTPIKTGLLPIELAKREGAIRSRHPINTMLAVGPLAKELMRGNLDGASPLACGVNSSWKKCVDNDAIIIGLGTDLTHSLTMIHVAEDVLDKKWPVANWYREKKFKIIDGELIENRVLRERHPRWGALHFCERTLCRDLIRNGILKTKEFDGVLVEVARAKALIDFLNLKNKNAYPYFGV
ncbi:MAG: AAC(3) family N-acetyltransferase [Gammaproteobacteria bacterium]|nr:AAC(3) family N-acetyltransferase [Gammaproteobacteria bacterium]